MARVLLKQQQECKVKEENKSVLKKRSQSKLEKDISFEDLHVIDSPPQSKVKDEVLKVIEEVKMEESLKRVQVKYETIMQEPSMKERYSQLLLDKRELVLPIHFKTLLNL